MILITKTSDQTRQRGVCACVCIFIKLHITAQSGPVIVGILYKTHCVHVCLYLLSSQ